MYKYGIETIDVLAAPCWLLANAILAFFAWLLSRVAFPRDGNPQTALSATLIYIAMIVGASAILGSCGLLKSWLLLTAVSSVSLVGVVFVRRPSACDQKFDLGTVGARSTPGRKEVRKLHDRWWWIGWLVLLACLAGHVIVNGLWAFPTEFDGLAYHIPLIDHWLQAESLYAPDAPMWWTSANAEVVGLWMVAPFSGDFFIGLGNVPFIILWVLAAIDTGRLVGLSVAWKHIAALAMLAIHTTFHEAEKAMNDLAVAACFFTAVAYGLRYLRTKQPASLVWSGTAIGLLGGTKYFALGYSLLVFCVLSGASLVASSWRHGVRAAVIMALTASPFVGYWHIRNLWLTGTPVYPSGSVGVGYPDMWQTTFVGNGRPELFELAADALWTMAGPCHIAAVAVAPLTLICLAWCGTAQYSRGKRQAASVLLAIAALLLGTAVVFAFTPFAVEDQPGSLNHLRWGYTPARYGLCFLSMAVLTLAWLLQNCVSAVARLWRARTSSGWLPRVASASVPALAAIAVAFQWLGRIVYLEHHREQLSTQDLISAGLLGAHIAAATWLGFELYPWAVRRRRVAVTLLTAGSVAVTSLGTVLVSKHWHGGFAHHYDLLRGSNIFSYMVKQPRPLNIAVLDHRPYAFFGSARQHRVCAPHLLTTYEELIHFLSSRELDLVVSPRRNTGNVFERYKEGPEWLTKNKDRFRILPFRGGCFALFSFVPTSTVSPNVTGSDGVSPGRGEHSRWFRAEDGPTSGIHGPAVNRGSAPPLIFQTER